MPKKEKLSGWPQSASEAMANFANPLGQHSLLDNPLTSSLAGGFDFVKALWGGLPAAVPGFIVPTVDLDELDRRIKDLKTVESWLAVNANMLRATIQSLEVQRNTVAAIKSIGGTLAGTSNGLHPDSSASAGAAAAGGDFANWPNPAPWNGSNPSKSERKEAEPDLPANRVPRDVPGKPRRPVRSRGDAAAASVASPPAAQSATSWLGFLQDQFNQVAAAALAGSNAPETPAPSAAGPSTRSMRGARVPQPKISTKSSKAPGRRKAGQQTSGTRPHGGGNPKS